MNSATAPTRRPGPIVNVGDYDLVQKVRALAATMDTLAAIYPQLQDTWTPTKKWIEFAQSRHRPLFEEPDRFAEVMRSVLADVR